MEIKDIIKNRRLELNMTMKETADKIGVSEGTISRWESGEIENMRRDKILSLAKALDISPALIMGWEPSATLSTADAKKLHLSPVEKQLITSYRRASPAIQQAVLKLLDIREEDEITLNA